MSVTLRVVPETELWAQQFTYPDVEVQIADWGGVLPEKGDRIDVPGAQGVVVSRTWRHLILIVGIKGTVAGAP